VTHLVESLESEHAVHANGLGCAGRVTRFMGLMLLALRSPLPFRLRVLAFRYPAEWQVGKFEGLIGANDLAERH